MTKAEFIRKLQNKEIKALETIYNVYGLNEAPDGIIEKHKGIREIINVSKTGIIKLKNSGDNLKPGEQTMTIGLNEKPSCLLDITENEYISYEPLKRELTPAEAEIGKQGEAITSTERYKKDLQYDLLTDYNGCYYEQKAFFEKAGYSYLLGGKKGSLYVDINDKKHVWDFSQRGRLAIKYRLIYNL